MNPLNLIKSFMEKHNIRLLEVGVGNVNIVFQRDLDEVSDNFIYLLSNSEWDRILLTLESVIRISKDIGDSIVLLDSGDVIPLTSEDEIKLAIYKYRKLVLMYSKLEDSNVIFIDSYFTEDDLRKAMAIILFSS